MTDLFGSVPPAIRHSDLAWIGYFDGDADLAQGFAESAEAIFARWRDSPGHNDRLLLPLIYNYRHALELVLKQAIRNASARLRFAGRDDLVLNEDELEEHFKRKQRHRLEPLGRQLAELLKELELEELPRDTMQTLARLHQLDPRGEAFRYANRLDTDSKHVNVEKLIVLFRNAFVVIHGGVLTILSEYADFQYQIYDAYGYQVDALYDL